MQPEGQNYMALMNEIVDTSMLVNSQAYAHTLLFGGVVIVIFLLQALKQLLTTPAETFVPDCDARIELAKIRLLKTQKDKVPEKAPLLMEEGDEDVQSKQPRNQNKL